MNDDESTPSEATVGEVKLDAPSGALHMRFVGQTTAKGADAMLDELLARLDEQERRLVILDLREASPWLAADVRRTLSERSKRIQAEKQAVLVSNPVVRMLAKTMLVWLGPGQKVAFVKDLEEARVYLHER